jgi:hypothetical protein
VDIPISLGHSSRANQLPPQLEGPHTFPDTPVFDQQHQPHRAGRRALQAVIAQRMDTALFARGQQERLIIASGGNLRDSFTLFTLFTLITLFTEAATNAILRKSGQPKISAEDCNASIQQLRREYRNPLDYGKPTARLPDATLYSLLQAKAVQEFNGSGWFGVHPLIVDFLTDLKRAESPATSGTPTPDPLPGGTL